jgi:hypothetical protein
MTFETVGILPFHKENVSTLLLLDCCATEIIDLPYVCLRLAEHPQHQNHGRLPFEFERADSYEGKLGVDCSMAVG